MIKGRRSGSAVGGALAVLMLLTAAGCGGSSPALPLGSVADSGFRPPANGLPFQNYGGQLSDGVVPVNLTAADVQKMFGDQVCADAQLRRCDLIPEAQAWLTDTNEAMSGGHCYGFSVLSELLWLGQEQASSFGAPATTALQVDSNQTLQRQIAYDWALQTLESVQASRVTGTPNQILAKLEQVLKPHPAQTYTLTFWKRDGSGGHAVTPYEVVNKGGGMFQVRIYDNNWPDDQTRAISFDTKADTWRYDGGRQSKRTGLAVRRRRQHPDHLSVADCTRAGHATLPVLRQGTSQRDLEGGRQHRRNHVGRQPHRTCQRGRHRRRRTSARLHQREPGQPDPRRPPQPRDLGR